MFPIYDVNRPRRKPIINYLFILINIVIFTYLIMGGFRTLELGIRIFGFIPGDFIQGKRLWTLLTSIFMHADFAHIFGNMLFLWVFGDNIEDALGHLGYLLFYLFGGIMGSLMHLTSLFFTLPVSGGNGFNIPSVGASGAISAVLGAYIILFPFARIRTIIVAFFIRVVSIPAWIYIGFWFLYQLLMGVYTLAGLPYGVAFWAHIGGFVYGFLIIIFLGKNRSRGREIEL
jgi:membrane associated rhomboid family serine protease